MSEKRQGLGLLVTCSLLDVSILVILLGILILLPPISRHFEKLLITTKLSGIVLSSQVFVAPLAGLLDLILGSVLFKRGKTRTTRTVALVSILFGILGILCGVAWQLALRGFFGHFTLG